LLAARDTVRLYAVSSLDTMRLGNSGAPNRNVNATIAADDERNAPKGLPWWIARGTLAMASTLSIGTAHSHGCRAKFAVESGKAISVQADSTRYAARNRKNVRHIQPLIRPCSSPAVLKYR